MKKYTAFIFARGGSKGLPDKNILEIGGVPLIAWSIKHAKSCSSIERVIVSTDSEKIKAIALEYGADVPFMRPAELATDTASELDAWRHAIKELERIDGRYPEIIISLPATSPLRISSDIDRALERYSEGDVDVVIGVTDAHRNPYFNMVERKNRSYVISKKSTKTFFSRQKLPKVFEMNASIYIFKRNSLIIKNELFTDKTSIFLMPRERSIDIDDDFDWEIAKMIIKKDE